jgi:hypothetical protein
MDIIPGGFAAGVARKHLDHPQVLAKTGGKTVIRPISFFK